MNAADDTPFAYKGTFEKVVVDPSPPTLMAQDARALQEGRGGWMLMPSRGLKVFGSAETG